MASVQAGSVQLARPVSAHRAARAGRTLTTPAGPAGKLASLQGSAGNAAVCRLVPALQRDTTTKEKERKPLAPLGPRRDEAKAFLKPFRDYVAWDTHGIADALVKHLEQPVKDYTFVRAVVDEMPSSIEDNVTAELVEKLPIPVSVIGLTTEGRAMLDVLYEAMITGNVSKYEREQGDKIVSYRMGRTGQAEFIKGLANRMIFPVRNIGVTRFDTATFRAELTETGTVKVWYTSVRVMDSDMFKADRETLLPWRDLEEPIELDPDTVVAVRLYDVDPTRPVDIPALALIDYANQIKNKTLDTAKEAFMLGLTVGMGGLGGSAIEGIQAEVIAGKASKAYLWGMRALVWADRVQFGIQAGAMVINDHRDWIVKTFPEAGPALLDAFDTANRIAGYYGWARIGYDGLSFIKGKLRPAADAWRSYRAKANLEGAEAVAAHAVEDEADTFLAELDHAGEERAAKGDHGTEGPAKPGETTRVTSGGDKEIHVSEERIEVCPIQRCPDLEDTVGTAMSDDTVAEKVVEAEKAAKAGDGAGAAAKAEEAMADAAKVKAAKPSRGKGSTPAKGKAATVAKPLNATEIADRGYPLGFESRNQFKYFGQSAKGWLESRGYPSELGVQGSAVTGYSASGHGPFDDGRVSDIDTAIVSPKLFEEARSAGIPVRDGHTRFPLSPEAAAKLNIGELSGRLGNFVNGRKVNIMVFESRAAALSKEPRTMWHFW